MTAALLIALLLAPAFANAAPETEGSLTVGVFPRTSSVATYKKFEPLITYLEAELGIAVNLETARDLDTFWQALTAHRFDLVHLNQYHYVKGHKELGYRVIAKNEEFGKATLRGAIAVRHESKITGLEALKGKTVVFGGGEHAMIAYMAPRYLLAQAGLGKHDYKTMFSKKPSNALFATYYGQADASGIGDIALKLPMIKSRFDASEIRILARSEPLPHLPWAVNSQLRPAQVSAIETALFRLNDDPRGKAILAAAGMTAIRPATDAEYDLCRRIIKLVSGEDYRSPKQEGADG